MAWITVARQEKNYLGRVSDKKFGGSSLFSPPHLFPPHFVPSSVGYATIVCPQLWNWEELTQHGYMAATTYLE
jgi:hypothetical protein